MQTDTVRVNCSRDDAASLFALHVSAIWAFVQRQPTSFWLINLYLFLEYVRPQSVWPSIDFLPWAKIAIVGALVSLILEGTIPHFRTFGGALLLAFTTVVLLSSIFAIQPSESYKGWELWFSWVLVFVLITNTTTTERRFFVFTLAFLLYSFKMSQHGFRSWAGRGFAFADWGVTGAPGWFHNSGEMGIQMCMFLPLSVEFIIALRGHWNRWARWLFYLFPITAVGSIVASSSRGAIVGGGCVALWWVARSKHRIRTTIAVVFVGIATWIVVPEQQKARFSSAGEDATSTSRIERWEAGLQMAKERPIFGIGYNNWRSHYGPLSHNIFIEAVAELGYVGLLAFVSLIVGTFVLNAQTRTLVRTIPTSTRFMHHMAYGLDGALIGYIASGFFVTVLYYPYFWINLSMTVALNVAARHERRRMRMMKPRAAGSTIATPKLGVE